MELPIYMPLTRTLDGERGRLILDDGNDAEKGENTTGLNLLNLQGVKAGKRLAMASDGRVSEGTRTPDSQIHNLEHTGQNSSNSRHSEEDQPLLTPCLHKTPTDPDLAEVVAAWTQLPEAIKAGVLALVRAAR